MTYGESTIRAAAPPLDELVRIVAHDVRTPLNTIAMATDMIDARAGSPAELQRYTDIIRTALGQVNRIVDDVLTGDGHEWAPPAGPGAMDARALLSDALEYHRSMAELKGVALEWEAPDGPACAAISREPLLRALSNLLANAIRHTPAGGSVRLTAQPLGSEVAFIVTDTGVGMSSSELDLLLQRTASREATRGRTGNGLGIVQGIARAAGGRLTAVTRPGLGSTFTILLPAASYPAEVSRQR